MFYFLGIQLTFDRSQSFACAAKWRRWRSPSYWCRALYQELLQNGNYIDYYYLIRLRTLPVSALQEIADSYDHCRTRHDLEIDSYIVFTFWNNLTSFSNII